MFRHEGEDRSVRKNQVVAGYLAFVAGFVNSAGFVIIGTFTSHVTGNVGRLANDLALGRGAAAFAGLMIFAYFIGAMLASMAIESDVVRRRANVYGVLLLCEALLLVSFACLSYAVDTRNPYYRDTQGLILCTAMGLQNSLVTRLSGAVVRTTHLTGVVTDLGIESARWFRHWRARLALRTRLRLVAGSGAIVEPQLPRTVLLLTIFTAFVVGSAAGAIGAFRFAQAALLAPTALLVVGGGLALISRRTLDLRAET